jgi:hypothetical protein
MQNLNKVIKKPSESNELHYLVLFGNTERNHENVELPEDGYKSLERQQIKNTWSMENFPADKFLLPTGTCEQLPYVLREDNAYSVGVAVSRCLERYIYFTKILCSDEELIALDNGRLKSNSTVDVNKYLSKIIPQLLRRMDDVATWSPLKTRTLKIYQIGKHITLDTPWEIPFSDPGLLANMDYYIDHRAKLCENGEIVYTELTVPDGRFISGVNELIVSSDDGSSEQPFLEGFPAEPEGMDWFCIDPSKLK